MGRGNGPSEAGSDVKVTDILSADLGQASHIFSAVQQLTQQTEDVDRQLYEEVQAHQQAKDRVKLIEDEHRKLKESLEQDRLELQKSKGRMNELKVFQAKSGAALKAMAQDLMAVRMQNEALLAEMDVQRKAFVVSVNWAQAHADIKAKYDVVARDYDNLTAKHAQLRQQVVSVCEGRDTAKQAFNDSVEELERKRLGNSASRKRHSQLEEELAQQLGGYDELRTMVEQAAAKRKKMRESARAAIQKSLVQSDEAMVGACYQAWKRVYESQKLSKQKKDQSMGVAMRAIANSAAAVQDFCLTAWKKEVDEERKRKLQEANRALEGKAGSNKEQADANRRKALAQLERQFGNSEKGLTREVFAKWQILRHDRMKRERAHAIAARSITSNGQMFLQQAAHGWIELWRVNKTKREKKAAGQARAMRLITDGANAVQDFCLTAWAALTKQAVATKKAKESGEKKALRMIASTSEGMRAQAFTSWKELVKKKNDQARKMKAVERGLVSSGQGMLQYIMHNWGLLVKKQKASQVKKQHGMNQSMKKIKVMTMNCLMEAFLAWAKDTIECRQTRLAEEATEKAKAVSEPDERVTANQAEVDALMAELQKLKAQFEEMSAKLTTTESKTTETERQIDDLERQLSRANEELGLSRRKAKDINEELSRVSAFLSKPRKPTSRPGSGVKHAVDKGLPPIKGPMSARGPGGARSPDVLTSAAASPVPACAWEG